MSKSRDIADSAATINYIDTVTSNVQTQLNTLDTALDNISVTSGTLTKTFTTGETASISLTSSVLAPVVSVTKEVPQTGSTNNSWDVNSTSQNYTRLNSAPATTLNWGTSDNVSTVTALANQSFGNGSDPVAVVFNLNGTKMYVTDFSDKAIYSYTLSTPWDVTTKSSLVNSFNLAGQTGNPHGMCFNSDGTIIFTAGYSANVIYKYVCSTAFDISSASYSQTLSGMSGPTGVQVNANGTKLYVSNNQNGQLKEWDLSTAYDLSTASYNNVNISLAGLAPRSMAFADNGTKLYIVSNTANTVRQYSLSSGFSLSNPTFVTSYDASGVDNNVRGIAFKSDFSQMFLAGAQNDKVYSYNFGTALALGSGSFASADVGKTIEANSGVFVLTTASGSYVQTTAPTSFNQVASGSWSMFGTVYNTTDGDLELSNSIGAGYDISVAAYTGNSFATTGANGSQGVAFNNDGSKVYFIDLNTDRIYQYSLPTPFSLNGASSDSVSLNVSTYQSQPSGLAFNADGTKLYTIGYSSDKIYLWTLTTAFDLSTASSSGVNFNIAQTSIPMGLHWKPDGTKLFIIGQQQNHVWEYTASAAYDITTLSFVGSFNVGAKDTQMQDLSLSADGSKLFVIGGSSDSVHEYSLSTAFTISSASFVRSFSLSGQATNPTGIAFTSTGSGFIVSCDSTDYIYEYSSQSVTFVTGYQPVHTTASTDTTYWTDINSMTADQAAGDGNVYYAISTDDRTTWTVIDNTDGERDIVRNNAGTWQYNSNATYASQTWANGTTNTELATIAQAMEGAAGSVPYDLANSTEVTFAGDPGVGGTHAFVLKSDGTRAYWLSSISGIYSSDLPSAFTGTGGSWAATGQTNVILSQDSYPRGLRFKSDGTKLFVLGSQNDKVYSYSLSSAWDVTNTSYDNVSFSVATQSTSPYSLSFSENGSYMYVFDINLLKGFQYNLSTAWDISSASYSNNSFSLSSPSGATGLDIVDSGTKMFVSSSSLVTEYTLSTAYDISSASASGDSKSLSFSSNSIQILDNGGFMALANGNDGYLQDINVTTSYPNQMDKTQLDAVTDPNHIALSNDFDLSIIFNMTSGTTVPSSNGVSINYDANILNQGAVLGTDYNFDAPAQNKVRITALAANNLKVRVV